MRQSHSEYSDRIDILSASTENKLKTRGSFCINRFLDMTHRQRSSHFRLLVSVTILFPALVFGQRAYNEDASDWKVTIFPVYAWAPVLGASIDIPSVPEGGGGSVTHPDAKVSGSFNGAVLAGFRIEKSGFSTHASGLWAGLSADRSNPHASLDLDVLYGDLMGGYEVVHNLSLEGGVRRMALKITANIEGYPSASRKPGIWDPVVGFTWRKFMGRKWRLNLHGDGGGFGVGSDVDVALSGTAEWRFARHFGTTFGYAGLHFDVKDGVGTREVRVKQTMHGPVFGFGIYF